MGHGGAEGLTRDQLEKEQNSAPKKRKKKEVVEEVSSTLSKELETNAEEERHARARKRFDFEVNEANAVKKSALRSDVQRVVESTFIDDIASVYTELEKELHMGDDHSDRGTLAHRLSRAAVNMRRAHKIFVTAKVEKEAWETRNAVIFGAMWLEATRCLQEEKDAKARNKQITDADVKNKAAAIFGDEWHAQETERYRVKQMVDDLSHLCDSWTTQSRILEALLGKSR